MSAVVKFQQTSMDMSPWVKKWDLSSPIMYSLSPSDDIIEQPKVDKVPVWLFAANGSRLRSMSPVTVEVSEEAPDAEFARSAYVFRCRKLHVFASAETYAEAENLFHEQVVHFYRFYTSLQDDQVARDAAEIRDLYLKNFVETGQAG